MVLICISLITNDVRPFDVFIVYMNIIFHEVYIFKFPIAVQSLSRV